jgi:hypothetical protein
MRIRLILLFHILLAICVAPAFAQGAAETGTKTLLIPGFPSRSNDPVTIKVMDGATELNSDGRLNHGWEATFNAGDDWMNDLSFVIKNVSPKKITCIIIFSVLVEAPFWQNESQPKLPVLGETQNRVGQRPEHALYADGRAFPPDTDAPFELAQGEEFTMLLEDPKDYSALKARIEKKLPVSNVTAMDGGIVSVFFEDGTRWVVGLSRSYSRPAEQPGKWTRISYEEWVGQPKNSGQ